MVCKIARFDDVLWFATPRTPPLWQRGFFLVNCLVLRRLLASVRSGVVKTFRYVPQVYRLREPLIDQRVVSRMANYLVHHTKKKQILARKEAALQRLIDGKATSGKLMAAAEDVRDARIRVLRVQRSIIVPKGDADTQYAKIDAKIETLSNTSAATILAEFGCAVPADGDFNGGASGT